VLPFYFGLGKIGIFDLSLLGFALRLGKSESYNFWLLVKHCPDTTPDQNTLKNFLFRRNKTGFLNPESPFYIISKL